MAQKLADWVSVRAKDFEVIAQKRDIDAPLAGRALELVRKYIIERRLILYGGQAIDFALRLKGSRIYPDHQIPDYDCFSPQNVDDAYELADRLVVAGFPHVGAIPAIHVQTMRVATNFLYVADISYAPPEVFDRLPTVSYAGLRILHPDYQRADMHLAFCFPFNNPPREDIFHRYQKDLARFRLLQKLYPITTGGELATVEGGGQKIVATIDLSRVAIHGFAAYAMIRRAFDDLVLALNESAPISKMTSIVTPALNATSMPEFMLAATDARTKDQIAKTSSQTKNKIAKTLSQTKNKIAETSSQNRDKIAETLSQNRDKIAETSSQNRDKIAETSSQNRDKIAETLSQAKKLADGPSLDISFSGNQSQATINFTPPAAVPHLAFATPWPDEIVAALSSTGVEWFHPYMDLRPLMARIPTLGIEIHSTYNRLLGVWKTKFDGFKVIVATPQYVLLNFLYEAHVTQDAALRDLYIKYYTATLNLLEAGGMLIAALRETPPGPAISEEIYQRLIVRSPFGLPIKTIGDANNNDSYLIRLARSAQNVGDERPPNCPDLSHVPARYYPGKKHKVSKHPPFDYSYFQRAGTAYFVTTS